MQRQTSLAKSQDIKRAWYVVDAKDQPLGRLASQVAILLMGKHKPTYTPNTDCGDNVIVINAKHVALSGDKIHNKKYYNVSGFAGGLRTRTAGEMLEHYPEEMMQRAVWGMIPKGPLGRQMIKKLFVYPEDKHDHEAQKPVKYELKYGGKR
ncbi:MAG: 50S ribosomal protein L13 [Bacilli bacterium]|nr:50S ribosomal protein L13 [Bacilli bacterium]MCQ2793786.1 50S ribosomal protein L13 [Bacilli bacterium]